MKTVCKPFKLFHSKWEIELRYQGQLKLPTPRMTKHWFMLYFSPSALGAPACDDLSAFEKNFKEDMRFIYIM